MSQTDIVALIVTVIGVASFAAVVTLLFNNHIKSSINEIKLGNRDIEIVDLMVYEMDKGVIRKQKAANVTKTILYYAFLAIIIPVFGLSLYSRIKDNVTRIGDNMVMVVASGSMSYINENNTDLVTNHITNQFQTYDIIVLNQVSNQAYIGKYDVIAFRNDKGMNVIHRVIGFQTDTDGTLRFITRGDANPAQDSYRPKFKDVIGKYTDRRLPVVGMFILFFQSYAGIITVLSVVYCTIMISHLTRKLDNATDERKEILEGLFDLKSLGMNDALLMSDTHENTIFFKGYAYTITIDGKTSKRPMTKEEQEKYDSEFPVKIEESKEK